MLTLVDLTRAFEGTEGLVLDRFMSNQEPGGSDLVECYLLPTQVQPSPTQDVRFIQIKPDAVADESIAATIHHRIIEAVESEGHVTVASFRPSVRAVTEAARFLHPGKIDYVYLNSVPGTQSNSNTREEWDSSYIPIDYAVDVLLGILIQAKSPIRLTTLRSALRARDVRFSKTPGTPAARPHFISDLVGQAAKRGFIRLAHLSSSDNNPVIQLTPVGHTRASGATNKSAEIRAQPAAAPTIDAVREITHVSESDAPKSASDTYIDILRQANLGPFQEVRWAVYDEIENLIQKGPITFYAVIRDAVATVRDTRQAELVRTSKPFPWSRVRAFIGTLLNRVPVFINEGNVVHYSWDKVDCQVDGLVDNWRQALDGELICFILEKGGCINFNDMPSLAGALYNSRQDDYQDRVMATISYLLKAGRITSSLSDSTQICLQEL